ncbi:hypothetical protein C2G38_2035789 [Gigaspora rosea]|uniref:Uncharacterized protein n=1 Tax=Gigaspora rosea TaxID=44941 RepID=A0A397VKS4_9GLOM|nr:hypothetical protein C2G38_2035789 [Gigaspora rosea]
MHMGLCTGQASAWTWDTRGYPWKTTQGCTSGNKDIDDCIREFQLKATEDEDVIKWIPFNRLNNIQKSRVLHGFQDSLNSLKEVTCAPGWSCRLTWVTRRFTRQVTQVAFF